MARIFIKVKKGKLVCYVKSEKQIAKCMAKLRKLRKEAGKDL